ncbi:diguanylate cyclase [Ideonella sp.]|uniref:GGDEF domain-containing protein n=1 Tax=Ideonella sp. TaxID=1929293 RepID=UPI0035AE9D0B
MAAGRGLDLFTLMVSIAVLAWMLAAFSHVTARGLPEQAAPARAWCGSMFFLGGGILGLLLRGPQIGVLDFLVANSLVAACVLKGDDAFRRVVDERPSRLARVLMAVAVAALALCMAGAVPYGPALSVYSAAVGVLFMGTAWLLTRQPRSGSTAVTWLAALVAAVLGTLFWLRAGLALTADQASLAPAGTSPSSWALFGVGALYAVAGSLALHTLVHDRHRREVVAALRRDGLTGVLTRRALFEQVGEALSRAPHAGFAVVMIDVDHFKRLNDGHGHQAGDAVLASLGRLLQNAVRLDDAVGRYGGEEFCLWLPGCPLADAAALAERVRAGAEAQAVRHAGGGPLHFTLSAGCAAGAGVVGSETPLAAFERVLRDADHALLDAKRGGRNRVVVAGLVAGLVAGQVASQPA